MVSMAKRKPPLMPRWRFPTFRGLYGTSTERLLRAADLWKPATFWKAADSRPQKRWQVNPNSGEHDWVTAANGSAVDNRGVNADVHCVVLSSRAEDS